MSDQEEILELGERKKKKGIFRIVATAESGCCLSYQAVRVMHLKGYRVNDIRLPRHRIPKPNLPTPTHTFILFPHHHDRAAYKTAWQPFDGNKRSLHPLKYLHLASLPSSPKI